MTGCCSLQPFMPSIVFSPILESKHKNISFLRGGVYTQSELKSTPEQVENRLQGLLGQMSVFLDTGIAAELTGQEYPVVMVQPDTEEQISALFTVANEEKWTVAPVGGGTHLGAGNLPRPIDIVIRSQDRNKVIDYSPTDMVVTVESGISFANLREILASEKQMLPIDPVCQDSATIGGLLSVSASGPMRAYYGTLRDMTIGLKTVYPDGSLIRTGGKVVKNVAGYDMTKLFVGSYGTLVYLSEITFKLRPFPLYRTLVVVSGTKSRCQQFVQEIVHSELIPSRVESLFGDFEALPLIESSPKESWHVAVDCDENVMAGKFQMNALCDLANRLGLSSITSTGDDVGDFWEKYRTELVPTKLIIRYTCEPKKLIDLSDEIRVRCAEFGVLQSFSVSVTSGVGRVFVKSASTELEEKIVRVCRDTVQACGGYAIVDKGSVALRRNVDAFGVARDDIRLMKGIKKTIDPNGIMNPGRLLGGI